MRFRTVLNSSLFCMTRCLTIPLQILMACRGRLGGIVCEAWGSLLAKVGYRTPEAFSGGVSRKAGCRTREASSIACRRRLGCLALEACLFALWVYRFLWLEVSTTSYCRRPDSLYWNPSRGVLSTTEYL